MYLKFILVAVLSQLSLAAEFQNPWDESPLFLTPLIRNGNTLEARQRSLVQLPEPASHLTSYSGLISVHDATASNMYFWFFEAEEVPSETAPLILWLQGGPGSSSMFGLFALNGPFNIDRDMNIVMREHAWTKKFNVLYVDNPVGVGLSFTKSKYVQNQDDVAEDFWQFFQQFSHMFPAMAKVPFYAAGESYAGKYVPALAARLKKEQLRGNSPMNFKGIMVGNGWTDPEYQLPVFGEFFFNIGQMDKREQRDYDKKTAEIIRKIRSGHFVEAFELTDMLIDGDFYDKPTTYTNYTGCTNYFDFTNCNDGVYWGSYSPWLRLPETQKLLHVGSLEWMSFNPTVETWLIPDILNTVRSRVEFLLNNDARVLYYSGNYDERVPTVSTINFLGLLSWKESSTYHNAHKKVWHLNDRVAGYATESNALTLVVVRDSGHMVPYDQPAAAADMARRFIEGREFN